MQVKAVQEAKQRNKDVSSAKSVFSLISRWGAWSMRSPQIRFTLSQRLGLCTLESPSSLMRALLQSISELLLAKDNSLEKDNCESLVVETHSGWEMGTLLRKGDQVKTASATGDRNEYGFTARCFRTLVCRQTMTTWCDEYNHKSSYKVACPRDGLRNYMFIDTSSHCTKCRRIFFEIALSFWW